MNADYKKQQFTLGILLGFNLCLMFARIIVTHSVFYGFLIWNLLLAALPFTITTIILTNRKCRKSKFWLLALSLLWLLVLPNAPYIITDFLHLRATDEVPKWFDVLLLSTYAFSGLLFGFASMLDMHKIWIDAYGVTKTKILMFITCLLTAFGVYLGRFLRYNSWDVLSDLPNLITDTIVLLTNVQAMTFTTLYGLFFYVFYHFFRNNLINQ